MQANVPPACTFPGPTPSSGNAYLTGVSAAGSTMTVPINAANKADIAQVELAFEGASCNAPMNLTMTTTPILFQGGTILQDFAGEIDYEATLSWNGDTVASRMATATGIQVATQNDVPPNAGNLTLTIITIAGTQPLMKGLYRGTLTLSLVPQS